MKKRFLSILFSFFHILIFAQSDATPTVAATLDSWHQAAAEANFKAYFDLMADDAVFIGTDATENWTKKEFEAYAKPHFDKGKAWSFTAIERNIYFNATKTLAWFDELLDTRMKICRGSGVMIWEKGKWRIQHYVLSMTVPNDSSDEVIKAKSPIEEQLIIDLKNKKQ